jgi:hypothetical protein
MISILLITWIVGFVLWLIFTRPKVADGMMAKAGMIAYIVGIILWCLSVSGVKVF